MGYENMTPGEIIQMLETELDERENRITYWHSRCRQAEARLDKFERADGHNIADEGSTD